MMNGQKSNRVWIRPLRWYWLLQACVCGWGILGGEAVLGANEVRCYGCNRPIGFEGVMSCDQCGQCGLCLMCSVYHCNPQLLQAFPSCTGAASSSSAAAAQSVDELGANEVSCYGCNRSIGFEGVMSCDQCGRGGLCLMCSVSHCNPQLLQTSPSYTGAASSSSVAAAQPAEVQDFAVSGSAGEVQAEEPKHGKGRLGMASTRAPWPARINDPLVLFETAQRMASQRERYKGATKPPWPSESLAMSRSWEVSMSEAPRPAAPALPEGELGVWVGVGDEIDAAAEVVSTTDAEVVPPALPVIESSEAFGSNLNRGLRYQEWDRRLAAAREKAKEITNVTIPAPEGGARKV